jgi:hypothetical protein
VAGSQSLKIPLSALEENLSAFTKITFSGETYIGCWKVGKIIGGWFFSSRLLGKLIARSRKRWVLWLHVTKRQWKWGSTMDPGLDGPLLSLKLVVLVRLKLKLWGQLHQGSGLNQHIKRVEGGGSSHARQAGNGLDLDGFSGPRVMLSALPLRLKRFVRAT